MHYSIYIPKVSGANPAHLAAVGLGDLVQPDDVGPAFSEVINHGPDGGHGMYISWPTSEPVYRPGQLQWTPAKAHAKACLPAGRFWWGIDPAQPVTSDDLIRSKTLKGKLVRGGDQFWLIPNLMLLPHEFAEDDQGEETRVPISQYSTIAGKCKWCFETIKAHVEFGTVLPDKDLRRHTIDMLTLNYRLFPAIAWHLRILNDDNWLGIAGQTVDIEELVRLEEEFKKKRQRVSGVPSIPTT